MKRLARLARTEGAGGEPLPDVMPGWAEHDIYLRKSQVHLLAALPGGGKSWVALHIAVKLVTQHHLPVLYFSADTNQFDMMTRAVAMMDSCTQDEARQSILDRDDSVVRSLSRLNKLRMDFVTDPTYDHLVRQIEAFQVVNGDYPPLIIMDNLGNIPPATDDEFAGLRDSMRFWHGASRETGSAILVLHHFNEAERLDPTNPPARKYLKGKVSTDPETIVSMAYSAFDQKLRFAAVKLRSGRVDVNAERPFEVNGDAERMSITANVPAFRGGW